MEPYEIEEYYPPPRMSKLAIASLVCALLCSPIGLALGILAILVIYRSEGRFRGMGLAISGIVVSCLPILTFAILHFFQVAPTLMRRGL